MIVAIFGKPGSGKSTAVAAFIQKNKRKKEKYEKRILKSKLYRKLVLKNTKFSNKLVDILYRKNFYDVVYSTDPTFQDTVLIDYENLGMWRPTWNSVLILEEAGVYLSNRDFKKLTKESKRLAAMHRHNGSDIVLVSQVTDFDKSYRSRAEVMFIAKKLGPITWYHRIPYKIDVDEEKHDIVEGYFKMNPFLDLLESLLSLKKKHRYAKLPFLRSHFIWRPSWYKYFDSYVDDFDYPQIAPDLLLKESNPNDSKPTIPNTPNINPTDNNNTTSQNDDDIYSLFFNP